MPTKKSSGAGRGTPASGHRKKIGGTQLMRKRTYFLTVLMLGLYMVVVCALMWYQLIDPAVADRKGTISWKQKATDQQLYDTELSAKRGTIYDCNMETLVQSTTAWVVTLKPASIKPEQRDLVVERLSEILEITPEYIEGRLSVNASDVKLKAKADKTQKDAILSFMANEKGEIVVPGITLTVDTKRTYSRGTLASTILGFTGTDNNGLGGLEQQYDTQLSGVPGRVVSAKNAKKGEMPFEYNIIVDAQQGNSLVLTLDSYIQSVVEKYLSQAVKENDVRNRACAIVINVNTGAILGMATMPDYDPADYSAIADADAAARIEQITDKDEKSAAIAAAQNAQWRNKCISDTYEPGSVFKPITMSAALEEGVASVNDGFNCPGYRIVGGRRISCHKSAGHGSESLKQGMMNSCNPVFMTLGERLGGTGFFKYFQAFGFTEKTGIDLPGEVSTVAGVSYHTEESLNKHPADLAVSSFGQTNAVSPIQMITAISAVCNGGYLVQPHVVAQVLDSNGNIVSTTEAKVKRQVISEQTSDIVNSMLEATVKSGTAKNGYIAGYRIGGKTGTSERIAETAATGVKTYVASFCAIAPSDEPEIALLVLLDDPRGGSHMGGTIAAPVARNIMNDILPYLGVETIYSTDDVKTLDTIAPNLNGKTYDEAKAVLEEKGLKIRKIGDGDNVTGQIPQAGQSIPKGGTVVVTTESSGELPLATVPNVVGMSPGEANTALTNAGLNIRYSGSGYDTTMGEAQTQSIPADTKVEQGTVVTVSFIMGGSTD